MANEHVVQTGDFIELNYTAKVSSRGFVFDTTVEADAKTAGVYSKSVTYKPLIVKLGEGQLLPGLEEALIGKKLGKHSIHLIAEKAFGKKNAKLLRLVSIKEFHKNQIQPMIGLEVELDGNKGIVRTVNGGRVIVDFNHPLSSQDLDYDVDVLSVVSDDKKKLEATLNVYRLPYVALDYADGKATVTLSQEMPKEIEDMMKNELIRLSGVKEITLKYDVKKE